MKRKLSPAAMNQTELAKRLGVSPQAVSSWTKGRALPEPERMAEIESILGIPMRDWVEEADDDESGPDLAADDSGEHLAVSVPARPTGS